MSEDLARNLRYLCAETGTIAQVCREIGINQQQFSKYLTGRARPSPHNLRRIARYFRLTDADLHAPHGELVARHRRHLRGPSGARRDPFLAAFPGNLPELRRYLGAYQVFYLSPAAPDRIVVAAAFLSEREGVVYSAILEALHVRAEGTRQWTRCDGKAAWHAERIFVIDYEARNGGSFMMTTLLPPHRYRKTYLFGMAAFLASHPRRMPWSSRVVWKRAEPHRTAREVLHNCGIHACGSPRLDPTVRNYLTEAAPGLPVSPPLESS